MIRSSTQLHTAQQDVYVDQLLNKFSPHYNIGGYIKLCGSLNKEKFREAVNSAAKVFDAFKMRFDSDAAEPVCYIDEKFEKLGLSDLDFSIRENPAAEAETWMQNRFNIPFIIKKDNLLFEHSLLKISENEHWFFGRYHHLITDGFGFLVFVQYLARKYKLLLSDDGTEFSYPSYLKEIENSSEYRDSELYNTDRKYWENKIVEKPVSILQKKFLKQNNSVNKSDSFIQEFSEEQRQQLEEIQIITNSGLQQLTIAALLIYFGKTSDRSEFIFGIPVHKRRSKILRNIVGMFSGVMPYKATFKKDFILANLLKEISQTQKSDYRHQNYPPGDISRNLKERSSADYLYEVSINYEPLNFELDFGNDIEANLLRLESDSERNPLQLFWRDYGNGQPLQLIVNFSNEYFSKEEIELFAKRVLFIIEQFPNALEKNIGNIKLIPETEILILKKFNDTITDFDDKKNIVKLFEEQASESPDRIALVFEDRQLTYRELNESSNQLAHYLRGKGVKDETLVPICIERSIEMLIGIIGILKAGAAYVPIDPEYPQERIRFILTDTNASMIVSSKKCLSKLPAPEKYKIISLDEDESLINKQPVTELHSDFSTNSLMYVIYTSGSTGRPKGVMIEHRTVVNLINAQSSYFNIKNDDRILLFSNYCFDASVEQIFLALLNGASLIMFPEGLQLNSELFGKFLKEKKISHLHATPSFLETLKTVKYNELKRVIAGGEVCKKDLADNWKDEFRFYNEYGPTETTVTAIEYHVNGNVEENISLPIGKPLSNIQAYILNNQDELCPIGVTGELCIAGDCLARGYLNHPELTKEKFVKNPFGKDKGSKMYKTGDLVRLHPDGNLEFIGRTDEQVKVRGYRIEPGEIESAIQESELVNKSVVVVRLDGSGNNRLVAYVVPEEKFDLAAVQNYLKKKLPEYMIPALWVELETFPLTSNGKIDKKALPLPDTSEIISSEYEAPDNELEHQLVEMWKEILKINKVGINDNFFELGGHSLSAIQLSSKLHKTLNIKTDAGTIFSNPTIRKLALALISEKKNQFSEINKLPEKEYYELSHAQKRFWILSNFKDGSEAYNVSNVFLIEGNLNTDAFKKAFNSVIERHEILRTVFAEVDSEPMQKILSLTETGFNIEVIDLRKNKNAEVIIKKKLEEDSRKAFNLKTGPLIRASLFREADDKYILVFNIHHIISDGWSREILAKDFLNFYNAYCNKEESNLAPLTIQYKDYAAWHNGSFEEHGKYWKEVFENNIPVLNFPSDYERPEALTYFGEMIQKTVSSQLVSDLKKLAVEKNMSLNNLLLSLYGLATAGYCSQEEVVIGTVSSGRSHPDLENLIGVFVNFLPVRLLPEKHLKLSEYLSRSCKTILQTYNNQEYPFDLMVENCIKKRDISRNPFFDTMINFQIEDEVKFENNQNGIKIKPYNSIHEELFRSVLDFKLDVIPEEGKLNFYLSYNSKLFTKKRMSGFLDEFIETLNTAVKEPDDYLTAFFKQGNETSFASGKETQAFPVNVCSSFVIEPVREYMEYWSKEFELNTKISIAPYNQMFQQLLNPDSLLNSSKGLNILFIRPEDWLQDKKEIPVKEQLNILNKTYAELTGILEEVLKKTYNQYLAAVVQVFSDSEYSDEVKTMLGKLTTGLESFLKDQNSVQLLSLEKIADLYDVEEIYDTESDRLGHMPFTPEFYAALGTYLIRKVNAFINPGYKVIALDCDNTLWKGICGESGALNVTIDKNYIALQEFFLEKYNEGFLLVLCSKNNEADVWEVFDRHPEMKLKREHISAYRINWESKSDNLLSLSKELNLGINSFIFIDDNEFETEQISSNCPDVLSLTLPEDSEDFSGFLNHIWAFDYFRITDEDRKRNEMYRVEKQRKDEGNKFVSLDDFLKTLELKVEVIPVEQKDIDRAVQLTLRTNQFNLNGIRRTPEEIAEAINDENSFCRIIKVKDRFGEYGITGLVLAKKKLNSLMIETFLLSCRVLGRNVEGVILSELDNYCMANGIDNINAFFKPTEKNKPFQDFLSGSEWVYDSKTNTYCHFIKTTDEVTV